MREGNPPRIRMLLADVGSIRFVQKKRAASVEAARGMESYLIASALLSSMSSRHAFFQFFQNCYNIGLRRCKFHTSL